MTEPDLNSRLAAALEAVMADAGVSQVALAAELKRSRSYVQGRLNGTHNLSMDLVISVGLMIGRDPDELLASILATARGRDAGRVSDTDPTAV